MGAPITTAEADMTAATYFTGKPCKHGHTEMRYVSTRTCVRCADIKCRKYQKEKRRQYLDRQNAARVKRLFGLDREAYEALLDKQGGGCAICGKQNASGRNLAVDHSHSCCSGERSCGKCIRGLLCGNCNHGLGKFKDDPTLLAAAVSYLNKNNG